MMDKTELEKILKLLSEKMTLKNTRKYIIFVAGGAALLFNELTSRVTKDVDIIALGENIKDQIKLRTAEPLPEEIVELAEEITDDFGLDDKWLNPGPTHLLMHGLPNGFIQRCSQKQYGEKLIVFFVDRYDLIHFKLYAAADQGPGKHLRDFFDMEPNENEIFEAAKWTLQQDDSKGFYIILKDMLKKIGYKDVAKRI